MDWIWWILAIVALVLIVIAFLRSGRSEGPANFMQKETELEILKGRFESGEISEGTYLKRKRELTGKG